MGEQIGKILLFVEKDSIGDGKDFPSVEYLETLSKTDLIQIIIRGACILKDGYSFDIDEGKEKLNEKIKKAKQKSKRHRQKIGENKEHGQKT